MPQKEFGPERSVSTRADRPSVWSICRAAIIPAIDPKLSQYPGVDFRKKFRGPFVRSRRGEQLRGNGVEPIECRLRARQVRPEEGAPPSIESAS